MPIRLLVLFVLIGLCPGLAAAIPPKVDYRFRVLQSTAGSNIQFLGGGAMNENGRAAWRVQYNDAEQAVFTGDGGVPSMLVTTHSSSFDSFGDPDINNVGNVVFFGVDKPVPPDGFTAIYLWQSGSGLTRVLREGDSIRDTLINPDLFVLLSAFNTSPKIDNSGLLLVPLQIFDGMVGSAGSAFLDRIYLYAPMTGDLHPLYEASYLDVVVPGRPWAYGEFAFEAEFNDSHQLAIWATSRVASANVPYDGAVVRGGVDPISPFDPLPLVEIANNTGGMAALRWQLALNASGDVLYQGHPAPGDPHDGLFIRAPDGSTTTVVAPNDSEITNLPDPALLAMNDARRVAFVANFPGYSNSLMVFSPTRGVRRAFSAAFSDPALLDMNGDPLRPGVGLLSVDVFDIDEQGRLLLHLVFEDLVEMIVVGSEYFGPPGPIAGGDYELVAGQILFCDAGASCTLLVDLSGPERQLANVQLELGGTQANIAFSLSLPPNPGWLPATFSVSGPIVVGPAGVSIQANGLVGVMPDAVNFDLGLDFPSVGSPPGVPLARFDANGIAFQLISPPPAGGSFQFVDVRGETVPEPSAELLQLGALLCLAAMRRRGRANRSW